MNLKEHTLQTLQQKTIFLFFSLLLLTMPVFSADSAPPLSAVDAPPLLYEMPMSWRSFEGHVELEVTVDGRLLHAERITFLEPLHRSDKRSERALAFELLAGSPGQRNWLAQLVAAGAEVTFHIVIDGQEMDQRSWTDLRGQGESIDLDQLQPLRVEFTDLGEEPAALVEGPPDKAKDLEACLEDCEDDYNACGTSPACQDDFLECASHCGFSGACTPSSTESSVVTPLGFQSTGQLVCTDYWHINTFYQYLLKGNKYKRTTTTVYTNFFCQQTTTVDVEYFWLATCWAFDSTYCNPLTPVASPPLYSIALCP